MNTRNGGTSVPPYNTEENKGLRRFVFNKPPYALEIVEHQEEEVNGRVQVKRLFDVIAGLYFPSATPGQKNKNYGWSSGNFRNYYYHPKQNLSTN